MGSEMTTLCWVTSKGACLWERLILPFSAVISSLCRGGTPWDCPLSTLACLLMVPLSRFCLHHIVHFLVFWLLSALSSMMFFEPLIQLWTWVHGCASISPWHPALESYGYKPKGHIALSYGWSIFGFFMNLHSNFSSGCLNLNSPQQWKEFLLLLLPVLTSICYHLSCWWKTLWRVIRNLKEVLVYITRCLRMLSIWGIYLYFLFWDLSTHFIYPSIS